MTSTQAPTTTHQQLYDTDFIEWIAQTAELLKRGEFSELDITNLIEEVEDWGRSQKQALKSNLRVLLMHLLKWQYQHRKRSGSWRGSWRGSIVEHRQRIQDALEDSPSLKNYYSSVLADSYATAREIAVHETGFSLDTFPAECSYTAEKVLDSEFLPE
ncbi:MAG: DUF29 domain-containing protein [Thermosynechococcaceae cyanobacterium]